jgi:hypothetical protein
MIATAETCLKVAPVKLPVLAVAAVDVWGKLKPAAEGLTWVALATSQKT